MTDGQVFRKLSAALWRRKIPLLGFAAFVAAGNLVAAIFFNGVNAIYNHVPRSADEWSVVFSGLTDVTVYSFAPAGALAIVMICFAIEALKLGWDKSSVKRVLAAQSTSCRTDLVFTALYASNLLVVLGYLATFGMAYMIGDRIGVELKFGLLSTASPAVSFFALILIDSLLFYLFHSLHHTRFLWELHKTHHAAKELVIITNFRNHPLTTGLKPIFFAGPAALLGVSPTVAIFAAAITGFIVLMQHTDMDWDLPFVEKYLIIGAAGHRLHHSSEPEHQGKNIGYLVFWDWLFGTLRHDEVRAGYGIVENDDIQGLRNSGRIKLEFWDVYVASLKSFLMEVLTIFRFKQSRN